MRVKFKDLVSFMEYATKEKPEIVSIVLESFKVNFHFSDSENRNCTITLFESTAHTTPELTKNMKLYTRFKETKTEEKSNE